MGNDASGRYIDNRAITLSASAAKTATFQSTGVLVGDRGVARLTLAVTAATGTLPTLDVVVETSADNSTWRSLGSFAQKTGAATERKSFAGVDTYVRINATIGGTTPSLTFSVAGDAV